MSLYVNSWPALRKNLNKDRFGLPYNSLPLKMGRVPCCEKVGLKKGPWTPEEDKKLLDYVRKHGHGNWRSVPAIAGNQTTSVYLFSRSMSAHVLDIEESKF